MRELHLQNGLVALVSDVDLERCRQHKWRADSNNASGKPYVRTTPTINGKTVTIYLHRFIVKGIIELLPGTVKVDHRNNDTLDCQRSNLRVATHNQNNFNRAGFGLSGYKGVTRERRYWRARITFNEVSTHLGYFETAVQAAVAYDKAAHDRFGEFAWLNFPEHYPVSHDIVEEDIPF
jgi:hypothetical protein